VKEKKNQKEKRTGEGLNEEQDKLDDDMASLDVGDGNTAPSPDQ